MERRRAEGTGFYGKTTLTRTLDLPLPVEDIARRRRRQSVRFEATFTGLHEGSASLSVLAGITFHVLCVPNHRFQGRIYVEGKSEADRQVDRNVTFLSKKECQELNAREMQEVDTM